MKSEVMSLRTLVYKTSAMVVFVEGQCFTDIAMTTPAKPGDMVAAVRNMVDGTAIRVTSGRLSTDGKSLESVDGGLRFNVDLNEVEA